jgi:hypothetical protein
VEVRAERMFPRCPALIAVPLALPGSYAARFAIRRRMSLKIRRDAFQACIAGRPHRDNVQAQPVVPAQLERLTFELKSSCRAVAERILPQPSKCSSESIRQRLLDHPGVDITGRTRAVKIKRQPTRSIAEQIGFLIHLCSIRPLPWKNAPGWVRRLEVSPVPSGERSKPLMLAIPR